MKHLVCIMINRGTLSLASRYSDCVYFYWSVVGWGQKESGCEGLDSYLTLSTLLMDPKLDCQKLRHLLIEWFFVDSSLTTNFMSQNHLKIEPPEIGNTYYDYQNSRRRRPL